MAKNFVIVVFLFVLGFCNNSCVYKTNISRELDENESTTSTIVVLPKSYSTATTEAIIEKKKNYRKAIREWYFSQIGVKEATNKNDGPIVEMYLKSTGLGPGHPWCAAFIHYGLNYVGVRNTINAYSPTAFDKKRAVWFNNKMLSEPRPGDVGTLYYQSKKRIAHAFFYDKRINTNIFESVEGNTNDAGSRDGDGVYKKKRSFHSTYAITDFIGD
jgi:hypothetical protein